MIDEGTRAEIELANMVSEPLLFDFVELKPFCQEGKKLRELSDLIITINDIIIPVEVKTQDRKKAKASRNEQKWAVKNLKIASNQIKGAINNSEKSEIVSIHPYRGIINHLPNQLKCKYGIIIIDYNQEPFELDYNLPRRTKTGIPIHYFSNEDFVTLCQKLMTLPDLLDYLELRSIVPSWATPKINDEKNFYAYYLLYPTKITYSIQREDYENYWDRLNTEFIEEYKSKVEEDQKVEIYNEILQILCTIEPIKIGNEPPYAMTLTSLSDPNRIEVSRNLNIVRRLHRREIARKLLEKIEKADHTRWGYSYFAFKTDNVENFYLFVASRNDRLKRKKELEVLAYALNNITNVKRIIGVATESKNSANKRSYDFIMFEDRPKETEEEYIQESKNFFKGMIENTIYEFPQKSHLIV